MHGKQALWHQFLYALSAIKITKKSITWYTKHTESFVKALKDRTLSEVKPAWVQRYFE